MNAKWKRDGKTISFHFLKPWNVLVRWVILNFLVFAASTLIFLAGSMITLNRERKVRSVLISVITLASIMLLFQFIFKVQLP